MKGVSASNLSGAKLKELNIGVFASKKFVERWKGDLVQEMPLLGLDDSFGKIPETQWVEHHAPSNPMPMRSSSVRTLISAAQSGLGAAIVPSFLAHKYGLIRIKAPAAPARKPFLVFHPDYRASPRMVAARKWVVSSFERALS